MKVPKPNIKIARAIEARTRKIVKFLEITPEGTLTEKIAFLRKEGYKDAEIILAMGRVSSFT